MKSNCVNAWIKQAPIAPHLILRLPLLSISFGHELNRVNFLRLQSRIHHHQLFFAECLELGHDRLEFFAQRSQAIDLRLRGSAFVAVDCAVKRPHLLAELLLAGDAAAFFGSDQLGAKILQRLPPLTGPKVGDRFDQIKFQEIYFCDVTTLATQRPKELKNWVRALN